MKRLVFIALRWCAAFLAFILISVYSLGFQIHHEVPVEAGLYDVGERFTDRNITDELAYYISKKFSCKTQYVDKSQKTYRNGSTLSETDQAEIMMNRVTNNINKYVVSVCYNGSAAYKFVIVSNQEGQILGEIMIYRNFNNL